MKKVLNLFIILSTTIFLTNCSEDENTDIRLSGFEVPIITGYQFRDYNAYTICNIGNPNIKLESLNNNVNYSIISYPNPANEHLYVKSKTHQYSQQQINAWLVNAKYINNNENTSTLGMDIQPIGGTSVAQASGNINNLYFNVKNLPSGYYRLYVKFENDLLYDNIVISKNNIYEN